MGEDSIEVIGARKGTSVTAMTTLGIPDNLQPPITEQIQAFGKTLIFLA